MKKKIRPLGHITTDLEPLLQEMVYIHELQVHEVLAIVHGYLLAHCHSAIEQYTDGETPIYYYGHPDRIKR